MAGKMSKAAQKYKAQATQLASQVAELTSSVKRLEEHNAAMAQALSDANADNKLKSEVIAARNKIDGELAFRTVEIFVYNENRKQTSRQYFGIAKGGRMDFGVSASGGITAETFIPTED